MAAKVIKYIIANTGTKDRPWMQKTGVIMKNDEGKTIIKMELMPFGWNGWGEIVDELPKRGDPRPAAAPQAGFGDEPADVPF